MAQLPPLNALHAFDVSGRRLSFRAAAEELGVTQAAVAQQVRRLEAHLGVVLFERLPKGLALTPVGRSFHAGIAEGFARLRDAAERLAPAPQTVMISVTPTFASKWLIPNLPAFTALYPEIDLRILATEKVSSFHSDGIDLAIRQGAPPFGATLRATRLFRQEIIAVAAPALVPPDRAGDHAALLAALPKIRDAHDLWPVFLSELGIEDVSARTLHLSQTALALDAALAGQGAALVSRFLVAQDLARGHLVKIGPISITRPQDFYLLSPRKTARDPTVSSVMSWLVGRADEGAG